MNNPDATPEGAPKISSLSAGHPARGGSPPAEDFRTLKATIPLIEFGAIQWAAKRSLVQHPNGKLGPMNLETFLRLALLDKLRAVVREEIAKGKPVPPDIAAVLDQRDAGPNR